MEGKINKQSRGIIYLLIAIMVIISSPLMVGAEFKYEGDPEKMDEPYKVDGVLIANKKIPLPSDYAPSDLETVGSEELTSEAVKQFNKMKEGAKKEGLTLTAISGYRSFDRQTELYNQYVERDGKAEADKYSARPGHSEHQTGLTIDVLDGGSHELENDFAETETGKWVKKNAHKYGYITRYEKGEEDVTGYQWESWHLRYIGEDKAKEYNEDGAKSLEEFLDIVDKTKEDIEEEGSGGEDKEGKEEDDDDDDGDKDKEKKTIKSGNSDNKRAKGSEAYIDREIADNTTGIGNKEDVIGGDLMLMAKSTSNFFVKGLVYGGVILVALMLLYTMISLIFYLVFTRHGVVAGDKAQKFMEATNVPLERSKKNTIGILTRFTGVILIIGVFLTGTYVQIMEIIFKTIEIFLDLF